MLSLPVVLVLVFSSTLFALIFINRERETFSKRAERHVAARQSSHTSPTPRVGGLAIAVGTLSGALLTGDDVFGLILWTTLPIFLIGLLEDLGPDTPPSVRLSVAALSAILAILVLGVHLQRVDVPFLDPLLAVGLIGMGFTVFASAGMTHAVNLIDGLNGLSSAVVIAVMVAFGVVAQAHGHTDLAAMNAVVCVAFLAFLCMNFPFGKIFLGDAGAYSIGHIIAWNAILLVMREPSITPWGVLLILLWPVLDTLFAMGRRIVAGQSVATPDRLHFHHVLMRLVLIATPKSLGRRGANPIGSFLAWPFIATPCVMGVFLIDDARGAFAAVVLFSLAYVALYHVLVRGAARLRRRLA